MYLLPIYFIIFLYGIVIGSFLNVCILRIPLKESISRKRSHCMSCGYQLAWFDLIPLFSWLALKGRCRKCGAPISPQYPLVEGVNGLLYVFIFLVNGLSLDSVLLCLVSSALLALSVIDERTFEIPVGFNWFIAVMGLASLALHPGEWKARLIGAFAVSLPLCLLILVSKGRAMGGGDMKLMAACGLFLGWKLILLAFFLGCILGSVIHILRMKISGKTRMLAMGPYLSLGVLLAALWGARMLDWYLTLYV